MVSKCLVFILQDKKDDRKIFKDSLGVLVSGNPLLDDICELIDENQQERKKNL